MDSIKSSFKFTGFGFDVLLHNVVIKTAHGEEYPDLNMNEVKVLTAKSLLVNKERLTGIKLNFLRTMFKLSYQKLSTVIDVPASTIRSWEEKSNEATGMTAPQERQFRIYAIETLIDLEKNNLKKHIVMTESYENPSRDTVIDTHFS